MNITEACASEENEPANTQSTDINSESSARKYVDVLVDLSEEDCILEDNMHVFQSRTGWEDAVEGWGKCSPFPVSPQPQRKGKNKTEITDSHCLLCADLKLSDLSMYSPAENDLNTIKKTTSTPPDLGKKTNTISSTSSDELYTFSQSLQNMPGPLINKLLCVDEQCTHNKTGCHYHIEQWKILHESTVALSIRSFSVLPPVNKSKNILKTAQPAEEATKLTIPSDISGVNADKRISVRNGTGNVITNLTDRILEGNSYKLNRSASTKNDTQMPPTFNITFQKKFELPSSTMANILPQFSYPLGRNLRQEDFAKPFIRNDATYKLHSAHKDRDLRRPEAHRLMLIGTRVRMPM